MRPVAKISIVVVAFAVLLAGLAFYVSSTFSQFSHAPAPQAQLSGPITLSVSEPFSGIYSINGSSAAVYSLISYSSANATNATVTMSVYPRDPVSRIYLLNVSSTCVACFNENQLNSELQGELLNYGIVANGTSFQYINQSALSSVPGGSIVIVPSGLLPFFMLNGTSSLISLLNRGDTVIYAGLNFSRSVGPNGIIFISSQAVLNQLGLANLDTVAVNSSPVAGSQGINQSFKKPTFAFAGGSLYGNATFAASENGTVIAFSNYPTGSWNSPGSMAADIARAIASDFWIPRLSGSASTLDLASRSAGNLGIFSPVSVPARSTANLTSLVNGSYTVLTITAMNAQSSANRRLVSRNTYEPLGSVGVASTVGFTQLVPVQMQVNSLNTSLLVHLDVYDLNLSYVSSIPIGFINSTLGIVKFHAFTLPSGYYLLELKDFNNRYFGGALFHMENVTITPVAVDFANGTFSFSVYSNGQPVSNATYSVNINGLYGSEGQVFNGAIDYTLPHGTLIAHGTENFNFAILNQNYTYSAQYQSTQLYIPTIYIEFGVAILVVVLLNLILKPPNRDEFYIDVPEFPPSKREKVKVTESAVLGVFDKVNYYHRWKYMPLTADELKLGIGNNIRVNNMPISITMQNANAALSALVQDKSVSAASGYYAPTAWVTASGHSVEYLAVFRKLRDYCVEHAILFTDLDSNSTADMLITKDGKQMSVFIYSSGARMHKLTISSDSKSAIVFLNDEAARDFTAELYNSYGKQAEVLKLGIEYNYVKLVDSDHLDQLAL
ncbi:MAG: hypothetical protein KGI04_00910 [Candidatus Micrarchaeota archaeon]|nr:hypothetical protein [Candidatus Micrarchaeota archaeon]